MEDMVDHDFWRGRNVLVTGHTGFKGAWLSLWLQRLGARVYGLALSPPTEPSLFDMAAVGEGMQHRIGDVRDLDTVVDALQEAEPEVVIHLAAQSLVRQGYADPLGTFSTNVMGTVHILEACRRVKAVRAVVIVTSDKCYENKEWIWGYRENDPLGGDDPYSGSKGAAELVTHSYRCAFFSDKENAGIASARAGNIIGGGDWSLDRFLPDFVRAATQGETLQVRNPGAVRPWQYVLEPLRGYLMLAEGLHAGDADAAAAWNFGPADGDARAVSWVVDRLASLWPASVGIEIDEGAHLAEAATLKLDSAKASAGLGWRPAIPLEKGLKMTVDWYTRVQREPHAARRCTLEQIDAYAAQRTPAKIPKTENTGYDAA